MPYVASIGRCLPGWGSAQHRVAGDDEDAVTLAAVPLAGLGLNLEVSKQAFSVPGMTPADMDVAEVHDFFTATELISYEDLGCTERFGGNNLLEAEETTIGGGLFANNSGGLTAKGQPPGATGVAHCVERFEQMSGEAVSKLDGARIGPARNLGGPTAVSAVTILEGPVACGR